MLRSVIGVVATSMASTSLWVTGLSGSSGWAAAGAAISARGENDAKTTRRMRPPRIYLASEIRKRITIVLVPRLETTAQPLYTLGARPVSEAFGAHLLS